MTSAFRSVFAVLLLPSNLVWQSPSLPALIASSKAKSGGTLVAHLASFPLTLRQVGPDSADAFRRLLDENDLSLLTMHPNDESWIPTLATHWALDATTHTVYYRLNQAAQWSDHQPVRASDYTFTLEFMGSPFIQSPWSNEYYRKTIDSIQTFVEKSGTEVIGIRLVKWGTDQLLDSNIKPMPRHFYEPLGKDFVTKYNWKPAPNTGPYEIKDIDKGRRITFSRKTDWWGKDLPFFRNRFNVDRVDMKVVPDIQVALTYLEAGDIDAMPITSPDLWRAAANHEAFTRGYLHRLQAYNDNPRNDYVLVLNQDQKPFQDRRVREAFAHAMNVDRVINELMQGDFQRLQGISQGYGAYTNPEIHPRAFDLKKVDELLKHAGWGERDAEGIRIKNNQKLSVTLPYGQSNLTPRLVVLQEDARKAGFELKLQLLDSASVLRLYRDKQQQIAFMSWTTPYRPEYRSRFHSSLAHKPGNSNYSNTADNNLDKLIDLYETANDERLKISKALAIQKAVFDEACYIPLFEVPYYRLAYASWLQFPEHSGTKVTDALSFFDASIGGLFWIDEALKSDIQKARLRGETRPVRTWIDESFRQRPLQRMKE